MPKRSVTCHECGREAELVTGAHVYPHRPDLYNKRFWLCEPCMAWVGVHEGSKDHAPLGRLANRELRQAKLRAHEAFDPLWKRGTMSRGAAYRWLAEQLGMPAKRVHIGFMDLETCHRVVEICAARKQQGAPW